MILARIVLDETDFADLVEGRQVQKSVAIVDKQDEVAVRIVLSDIGFGNMTRAVQVAWKNAGSDAPTK